MKIQELIEYLDAVCDAENAIYACNEAIDAMDYKMEKLCSGGFDSPFGQRYSAEWRQRVREAEVGYDEPPRPTPNEPHFAENNKTITGDYIEEGASFALAVCIVLLLILTGFLHLSFFSIIGWLAAAFFLLTLVAVIFQYCSDESKVDEENALEARRVAESNRERQREYDHKVLALKAEKRLKEQAKKQLLALVAENEQTRARLEQTLQQLYDRNILHANFRNITAVHSIRDYLEMGVCTTLDSPTGAYAEYLKDLRTEKICGSISNLKYAVIASIQSLSGQIAYNQNQLIREIRATNDNMTSLMSDMSARISNGLDSVRSTCQSIQSTQQEINSSMKAANAQINEIRKISSTSAHNEYIALRETNIKNYLLKNPHFL